MKESKKNELIKKTLKTLVESSKNLKEPETEEQQKLLDEIYNDVQNINKFLDEIIEENKNK